MVSAVQKYYNAHGIRNNKVKITFLGYIFSVC